MNYAFQIRAASKAKAKKAVEKRLAAEGSAPDRERGLAVAAAHIDALPDPGPGEDVLVVLNGSFQDEQDSATSRRITGVSGACSAYLVPREPEAAVDPEPVVDAAPLNAADLSVGQGQA